MCTVFVCFPGCDLVKFEINLIFLIKPFSRMTKHLDKNLNILRMNQASKVKQKVFFIFCKGHSVVPDLKMRL